ncbi:MAG: hypothetical protein IMW84_02220 [Thermoanaerobacter sp.]|nr:hypothetical protein [Thermoanaerobacter sp.]
MNKFYLEPIYYKIYFSNKDKEKSIPLLTESILNNEFPQYQNPVLQYLQKENIKVEYIDNAELIGSIVINTSEPHKWKYFTRCVNEQGEIIKIEDVAQGVKITFLSQNYFAYKKFYNALLRKFYLVNPKVKHFSVLCSLQVLLRIYW